MSCSRISIAGVMVVVAIAAVNCAYLRSYCCDGTLVGTRPIVVIIQVGLLCAFLGRPGSRRFWAGFVAFGMFALIGWLCAFARFEEVLGEYFRDAMNAILWRFPLAGYNRMAMPEPSHKALAEVLLTAPQLLFAVFGGLLVAVISRLRNPTLAIARSPRDMEMVKYS